METANILVNQVFHHHGLPNDIIIRSWTTVHHSSVEGFLFRPWSNPQPIFWVLSSVQWPSRTSPSLTDLAYVAEMEVSGVGDIIDMGREGESAVMDFGSDYRFIKLFYITG